MKGGVIPRVHDLYAVIPEGAESLEDVRVFARFGDEPSDVVEDTIARKYTVACDTPIAEATRRTVKHLFSNRSRK